MIPLLQRAAGAWRLLTRGSIAPFDRIPIIDGAGGNASPLRRPYAESVWVHAAVRHISRPITAASLVISAAPRERGVAATTLADARLAAFWARPARRLAGLSEFILASVGWRKLAGEVFWIMGDDALVPFPEVRDSLPPMILARPDQMRHVTEGGELVGWEYRDAAGRRHALLPKQVIHLRQWNPYDEFRGLGDYEAAAIAAAGDADSARFSRNLAASNGDQGVYVVAKSGAVEDGQRKQIVAQLRDKAELQRRGVFRPVFLTGDIEVQDPKVRSVDASFLAGRQMSAAEIFVAFGVPPSMAKESASYSIGGASDYFRLILDTCQPEAQELAGGIAAVSSRLLGRTLHAWFSWDDHPVMQEVRKERTDAAVKLWGMGVPSRVISEHLDLALPRFDGDDVPWVPVGVLPAVEASMPLDPGLANEPETPGTPPPASDQPETDPLRALERALEARVQRGGSAEARLWNHHMRLRRPAVTAFRSTFTRILHRHRREVLQRLEGIRVVPAQEAAGAKSAVLTHAAGSESSQADAVACRERSYRVASGQILSRGAVVDFILGIGSWVRDLVAAFRGVHSKVLDQAVGQLGEELGRDPEDPLKVPPPAAQAFLAARENRISGAAEETFAAIKAQLQAGLDAGETTAQLADRVRSAFNGISKERATRIAMTETAAAYGHARNEGMKSAGVTYKQWLTSGADNVRPAHREANRQVVRVSDPFLVGGESLLHPGDPAGSAANVINCHCVSVAVPPEDEPEALAPAT